MKATEKESIRILLLRFIFAILIVAWCVLIFCMSNETAIESSERSTGLVRRFIGAFVSLFGGDENDVSLIDRLEYYVRKGAHMFLYFVLSSLVVSFLSCYSIKRTLMSAWTLLFCLGYSLSDELHQLFIAGRSGSVSDILIDMTGAAVGLCFMLAVFFLVNRLKKRTV